MGLLHVGLNQITLARFLLTMSDILIKNATILKQAGQINTKQSILIHDGHIQQVGDFPCPIKFTGEIVDGADRLYLPGLIDSHLHTGQQLLRGRVLDAKPVIWTRIMLPFESQLTASQMKLSAELAALEMITGGTTGFVEAGSYHMESAAEVYARSGLRGALTASTMDEPQLPASIKMSAREAVAQTTQLYQQFHHQGRLQVYYSLRALTACSDELIDLAAEAAQTHHTFLTAHMNEYPTEILNIIQRTGLRPYEWLAKHHLLNDHFLGAHSLFLSTQERKLIKKNRVKLCHCPFSNAGKGIPVTPELLQNQIPVGLGTDGAAHGGLSLWNEIKIFCSLMVATHGLRLRQHNVMPAAQIFRMLLEGGAAALNHAGQLGKIKPGYKADLIAIDLNQPHLYPSGNWQNTLLECVNANDVTDTMVDGQFLMRNRQVLTLDQERIIAEARNYACHH